MLEPIPNLRLIPDPEAVQFRAEAQTWGGDAIVAAWDYWVATIHGNPLVTLAELRDLFIEWRNGFGPPIDFDYAVSSLQVRFGVVGETDDEEWAVMRGIILSKTPECWKGLPVVPQDGWRVSGPDPIVGQDFRGVAVELAGPTTLDTCMRDADTDIRTNGYLLIDHNPVTNG